MYNNLFPVKKFTLKLSQFNFKKKENSSVIKLWMEKNAIYLKKPSNNVEKKTMLFLFFIIKAFGAFGTCTSSINISMESNIIPIFRSRAVSYDDLCKTLFSPLFTASN